MPHAGPFRGGQAVIQDWGLGSHHVALPHLPDLSSGQEGLPALRDTRESVGLDILEIHLCDLTASALALHLLEPCLFQPNVALVRGHSFSCAKALEGTGEAELALGLDLRVLAGGVLAPQQKGQLALVALGGHCPRAPSQAVSYPVCWGPGIRTREGVFLAQGVSPRESGYSRSALGRVKPRGQGPPDLYLCSGFRLWKLAQRHQVPFPRSEFTQECGFKPKGISGFLTRFQLPPYWLIVPCPLLATDTSDEIDYFITVFPKPKYCRTLPPTF